MTIRCARCGRRFAEEVAVDVGEGASLQRFCTAQCAHAARAPGGFAAAMPASPRRILVAFDGAGPALRALGHAAMLARAGGGEVHVVTAVDDRGLHVFEEALLPGRIRELAHEVGAVLRRDAEEQLQAAHEVLERAGVRHTTAVETGTPLEVITAAARKADLVVMGSRGLGAVSGVVLGSMSHRLLGATTVPVLVVP